MASIPIPENVDLEVDGRRLTAYWDLIAVSDNIGYEWEMERKVEEEWEPYDRGIGDPPIIRDGEWETEYRVRVRTRMSFDVFTTVWDTSLGDGSNEVILPLGEGGDIAIDWGDGKIEVTSSQNPSHVYSEPGEYTVRVWGQRPSYGFGSTAIRNSNVQLTDVLQWGELGATSLRNAFDGATNLRSVPPTLDGLGAVTDMGLMFYNSAFNGDISNWDVSNVTDMEGMFYNSAFNGDISNWDVSSVTNMGGMFLFASAFNGDISGWDVSSVTDMSWMFYASSFNGDISGWDVSSVTNMDSMFFQASLFNQDLSGWCVTNIPTIPNSFDTGATSWTLPRPVWGTCPE